MSARRVALVTAALLGIAVVVVIAVRTPWTVLPEPPGGYTEPDPTAGLEPDRIARAEAFADALRPASLLSLVLGLAVSAVLGLTPLGARLVRAVGARVGGRWPVQVLVAVPVLLLLGRLVTLPVSAYAESVRRSYGLSTRSWLLWLRDVAVSLAISAALTVVVVLALLWLVRRAPRSWWAWAGAAAAGLVVVGSFLYPVVIEPAFNSFEPLPAGELRSDLLALAEENGTPVQDVLVSDASRRTTALNAYVSGFGSTRRIVVYDTLLGELPDGEIESIVAHELGHVAADDVLTGTLMGALGAGAATALLGWLLSWTPLLRRAGAAAPGDPRVVPLLLFLVSAGGLLATPVQNLVSRQIEQRADLHALELTRDPEAFVDMQQRLARTNLGDPDPPAAWHWFFGSHPTTAQRLAMAADWARLEGP
ncbi:M48 family metallopeptidase [Blastococcus sp. MG754426]|uniref:M48 family metallopeptidase n=1 Tax=unclassified Blastococcus TaxID=2619396 RepID=UPI001EEFDC0A|nr:MULTISPECIES: M48 family metallopeptidase [unclassified Blastococcus]MCF6508348.1 M48 family metallopeptidase [Blastococcus sp. MG754426]MCF6510930.1 M48 family metallopeptidase [Blastococcus sp. MG754427]MCF6733989.1 M48 family metallopeptidase [Blastococcus sp. KM273129]